jgi:lysophospholipase L1-like esterase
MAITCAALGCAGRGGMEELRMDDEVRYLALGDSYTIGEGVENDERWPAQLAVLLRARGIAVAEPQIVARTGWTAAELDAAIDEVRPRRDFDLVSLLIGVNNQYRGEELSVYRTQFTGLLRRAMEFAGGNASRVVVLSIPDWGVTPFAEGRDRSLIASEIDAFNTAARAATEALGARWVDVTAASRQADADRAMLVADGLHPSVRQYARWAALALPAAAAALGH